MKILSADEIRLWDQYTIEHEPIPSIELMERAASKCVDWILEHYSSAPSFSIFCGKGNNGGDGLAIARMLLQQDYRVTIHILEFGHKGTNDFQINLAGLHQFNEIEIHYIQAEQHFQPFPEGQVIIDALFGSGLNRGVDGMTANLINHINNSGLEIISIDLPSGLFTDRSSKGCLTIKANHTLSFQCYKLALLLAENATSIGEVHLLDIGLHKDFYSRLQNKFELLDDSIIHSIFNKRNKFSHKGNFGHALLVAGSYGKIGAAVLAAKACLRSGAGLLTCHIPKCGYEIIQTSVPEAMVIADADYSIITNTENSLEKYACIGIGSGIGNATETIDFLKDTLLNSKKPVILDADALNIIAQENELLHHIPEGSILTPHPKEFERLFGKTANDFDQLLLAIKKTEELNCIIILKGHYSLIATPGGKCYFNSTGNAGMATGGSGDVLTGILTGLLAQGYTPLETALLGAYLHGLAGDFATKEFSEEALVAGDIISMIGKAFISLSLLSK